MAENPLLPDAELRALHALLKQASRPATGPGIPRRAQPVPAEASLPARPALLAGTLLQLQAGDTLVSKASDSVSFAVLTRRGEKAAGEITTVRVGASQGLLATGVALAWSQRRQQTDRLVLVLLASQHEESGWRDTLQWAQEEQLPFVVACADPSGEDAFLKEEEVSKDFLTWTSLQKPAAKTKLPILTVDGEDAVAVYRVMQESALRARSGGGPAVLWAALPTPRPASRSGTRTEPALVQLEHFLRSRKISLRAPVKTRT